MVIQRSPNASIGRTPQRAGTAPPGTGRGARRGEEGYNLVMLIMAFTLLNVLVAIALPLWSYTIRRDREEETIFRGLQYAEGIRVFRQRFGRYPSTLEELVKVEPRSIRQLWNEPLSEDGEFGLVVEAPPQAQRPGGAPSAGQGTLLPTGALPAGAGGQNVSGGIGVGGGSGTRSTANLLKLPRASGGEKTLTTGAPLVIHGVYLDHEGDSLRKFFDQDKYEQWIFTAELIAPPVSAPGRPLPRVRDDWLGKSFPKGLTPATGAGGGPGGRPLAPGTGPGTGAAPGSKGAGDRAGASSVGRRGTFDDSSPADDDDAPDEFPEDFPDDAPEDEAPPPEETFPEDLPDPGAGDSDTGADQTP